MRIHLLGFITFALLLFTFSCINRSDEPQLDTFRTTWQIKPSLKYDLCSMIGVMTGRSLYQKYHADIYGKWSWKLPAPVKFALTQIDQIIGADWPPGPRLGLLLSALSADDSLSAILQAMQNDKAVYENLMASEYGSQKNWKQWVLLKPHLQVVISYLAQNNFDAYWRSQLLPAVVARIPEMDRELQAYDVVGDLERFLVEYDYNDTVTVYLLSLAQPHEWRIQSQCRATDYRNPVKATVLNFYSEMLHPYCDRLVDTVLTNEFEALIGSSQLSQSYQKVSPEGKRGGLHAFVQKEVVLAPALWLGERRRLVSSQPNSQFDNSKDAVRLYLTSLDDGAHVLAAVIYSYLEAGLKVDRLSYGEFVEELFYSGRLQSEKIVQRHEDFMNHLTVQ